jgi:hypothetical protein
VPGRQSTTSRCVRPSSRSDAMLIHAVERSCETSTAKVFSPSGIAALSASPGHVLRGTLGSGGGEAFLVRFRYARSNSPASIVSSSCWITSSVTVKPSAGSVARQVAGSDRSMSSGAYHSK